MTRRFSLLRTVVVASADDSASVLRTRLLDAGCEVLATLAPDAALSGHLARLRPALVVLDAASDARSLPALVAGAGGAARIPVVVFTDDDSEPSIEAAMAAGVSAYVVAGMQSVRLRAVLQVALARFRHEQKLHAELSDARHKLAGRKVIDRAKGILMARHKLTEDQAYQKLRTMAMSKNLKLEDLAQRLLDVEDLLG
ncbi:ANTAR domain-containing response regulator [Massilia cavernae]|uniref:ANTAR domain-containing protein n=1 Tax=Massilia cavernae TaxID=2320864 RepID=A0A418Y834_9BURK|nr:ANTAR domain-containing protein [Massilia cavernae]RJG27454.1 ANTAR domain-containing protein [Massilia cavernae]